MVAAVLKPMLKPMHNPVSMLVLMFVVVVVVVVVVMVRYIKSVNLYLLNTCEAAGWVWDVDQQLYVNGTFLPRDHAIHHSAGTYFNEYYWDWRVVVCVAVVWQGRGAASRMRRAQLRNCVSVSARASSLATHTRPRGCGWPAKRC